MRSHARFLTVVAVVALVHAGLFIAYQQPDWNLHWSDQGGYHLLGRALAETGRYTRVPDAPTYVPEGLRTPGYPLFVAAVYRLFGVHHLAVALAQAAVFVAICALVYALGLLLAAPGAARVAALATALYPPIPYYGALILTEVWTTLLVTLGLWLAARALAARSARLGAAAGGVLGLAGLTRPIFFLLPAFVASALAALMLLRPRVRSAIGVATLTAFVAAWVLVLSPWFAYNYHHFHRLTISPAGGFGRSAWEGYWNGKFPGRVQAALTRIAESSVADGEVPARIAALGHADAAMLTYVSQWREIRRQYASGPEPMERMRARVKADGIFWRYAVANIRAEPGRYLVRRLTHGIVILWAAEIPVRYSDIDRLPTIAIRAMWAVQAMLLVAALVGAMLWVRRHHPRHVLLPLVLSPVYLSLVQWMFLTEARYSLPLKPLVILFATVAVIGWRRTPTAGVP